MAQVLAKVLHLSDLHFGAKGQPNIWNPLADFIRTDLRPDVILITGDIVDSPRPRYFKEAQKALRELNSAYPGESRSPVVLACPGNHDRFFFGNRIAVSWPWGKQFEHYFGDFEARLGKSVPIGNALRLDVTSIDSTENCNFFARGAVSLETRKKLQGTAIAVNASTQQSHSRTLRILLMHHHLLPIAELEWDRDGLIGPFLNATTSVANPGRVLQSLTDGKYDIVLHGHEHAFGVARYAGVSDTSFNITVIAAPSSTGTVTGSACQFSQSRLNVLELDADETLWLRSMRGDAKDKTWRNDGSRMLLLHDLDLRRAWYLRANLGADSNKGIRWLFELRENFDARVSRTYCDLVVREDKQFRFSVAAVATAPVDLYACYVDTQGSMTNIPGLTFVQHPERRNVFSATIPLVSLEAGELLPKVITRYTWRGAANLTKSRIQALKESDMDFFYKRFMESVYAFTSNRVAWIEISVLMPLKWAPQNGLGGVSAFVKREGDPEPAESKRLTLRIVPSGDGHYSLRIPFPDVRTRYYLAWKVFDDLQSLPAAV